MLQPKGKDWLNGYKKRPLYMLSTRDPPQNKGHIQTESEGLEKYIPRKQRPKESRSSNTHIRENRLKTKAVKRDKESHYIMIKGSIQEEDVTIINIYVPKHRSTAICKTNANKYERGN